MRKLVNSKIKWIIENIEELEYIAESISDEDLKPLNLALNRMKSVLMNKIQPKPAIKVKDWICDQQSMAPPNTERIVSLIDLLTEYKTATNNTDMYRGHFAKHLLSAGIPAAQRISKDGVRNRFVTINWEAPTNE